MINAPDHDPWGRDLAGEPHELTFESEVLRDNPLGDPASRPLLVYTPPGWPDGGPHPAVWTIQGLMGQADQWRERPPFGGTFYERLDRMIVAGTCRRVVVPMPGCWTSYGGSQFLDSAGTGRYMTYVCDELAPWVDEHFATAPDPASRAVQGKSSGGYGALVLAMLRPDAWGALAPWRATQASSTCICRALRRPGRCCASMVPSSRSGAGCAGTRATRRRSWPRSTRSRWRLVTRPARRVSPCCRSTSPTARCAMTCGERWLARDPVRMLDGHLDALRGLRAISLECGRQDEFNIYVGAATLHRRLDEAGIEYRFELFDGGHGGIAYRYAPLIAWLAARLS